MSPRKSLVLVLSLFLAAPTLADEPPAEPLPEAELLQQLADAEDDELSLYSEQAYNGALTVADVLDLEASLESSFDDDQRDRISRILIENAMANGDRDEVQRLRFRHLTIIDPDAEGLALLF